MGEFWDWVDWENGCPRFQHPEYPCGKSEDVESEDYCGGWDALDQIGCWVKYYIWKHNQKSEKKDG